MNKRPPTLSADPPRNLPLPGMAAISLWMLALAIVGVIGVVTGHFHAGTTRITVLLLATFFAVAGLGLIRGCRWGWALTLAAAFLSMCFACFGIFHWHQTQWVVMGVVNFVFFLYLVRSEVVERLH